MVSDLYLNLFFFVFGSLKGLFLFFIKATGFLFAYFAFSYRVLVNDQNKFSRNIYDELSKINELVSDFYYRYHCLNLDDKGFYEMLSIRGKIFSRIVMLGTTAEKYPFHNPFFYVFNRLIQYFFGRDSDFYKKISRNNINSVLDDKILSYQSLITDDSPLEFLDSFPTDLVAFKRLKSENRIYDEKKGFFSKNKIVYLESVFLAAKSIIEFLEERKLNAEK